MQQIQGNDSSQKVLQCACVSMSAWAGKGLIAKMAQNEKQAWRMHCYYPRTSDIQPGELCRCKVADFRDSESNEIPFLQW